MPLQREFDSRTVWGKFRRDATPLVQAFRSAHTDPAQAQREHLSSILSDAVHTPFGRHHDFASIDSYETYADRVPVRSWREMQHWIDCACSEQHPVLTEEHPQFFEPTSGSSAARKLVPYTRALLLEFQQAIVVWLAMLYDACPEIALGRSYWAMSPPVTAQDPTENGIPVGGASDMTYLLGSCALPLLGTVLNPPRLSEVADDWRVNTLESLIAAVDLRMISVWSPTFLIALLRLLVTSDKTADALRNRLDQDRHEMLDRALIDEDFSVLWPDLEIVSCWMDGPSERFVAQLREWFPQTEFSPKGLLATEGVISISNGIGTACPLALTSHFLEFANSLGRCVLADSLERGERYHPILTTSGGLYRYALGDIVEYLGVYDGLHCVRFVGRTDTRSDLVGEKLDEDLVEQALTAAGCRSTAATLVPMVESSTVGYALLIDEVDESQAHAITTQVETQLMSVHHYAQARRLGQLAEIRAISVSDVSGLLQDAWESIGRRAGDLKPGRLIVAEPFARAIMKRIAGEKNAR